MGWSTYFGWLSPRESGSDELPNIFPFPILESDFVKTDVISIYTKILTDVCERMHGLPMEKELLLWDNCLKSSSSEGLITMLARAMTDRSDLFLVYDGAIGIVREADFEERRLIESDYKVKAESDAGVFVSFKKFTRSDMVKLYSALEFCTIGALHKSMNLSKAVQIKINELRTTVSLADSATAKDQAIAIANNLAKGRDIMTDAADKIETAVPNLEAAKTSVEFINQKRAFYLGMPAAYITGEQTTGMGTTGENDTKAIERGLKNYFFSIMKPVVEELFEETVSYKSQDFRQISQGLEAAKTFSLIDDSLISFENKQTIINQLFDFDTEGGSDLKGEPGETIVTPPKPSPTVVPTAGNA